MKFGVCLPNFGSAASKEAIMRLATEAEKRNYDSIWSTDHILVPTAESDPYGRTFEALTTLAFVSSFTKRIRLGTSVLVLPMRNSVFVAKQAATVDALSDGRLILGLGVGWLDDEFRFLNADFHNRARFMDEAITVMRTLWTQDHPSFTGQFVRFSDIVFLPRPKQKSGPPIWIGGNSDRAIERAARLGDAWHPVGVTVERLERGVRRLKSLTEAGRKISVSMRARVEFAKGGPREYLTSTGERRQIITGTTHEIIDTIERYRRAGLEYLVCYFDGTLGKQLRQMIMFAREVAPSFKK